MKVIEIFKSIDGEGLRTGVPVVFVRLEGCNLRCSYCDTKYSYENAEFTTMPVDKIVENVLSYGLYKVTLTGGEPLAHPLVEELVAKLINEGIQVNIETNGSISVRAFHEKLVSLVNHSYDLKEYIMYTVDYKCKSSLMSKHMVIDNLTFLSELDSTLPVSNVVKFVVGNEEDLEQCRGIIEQLAPLSKTYLSPVFGAIEPKEIVDYVLNYQSMYECVVQVQLHKIIWDPEVRGV